MFGSVLLFFSYLSNKLYSDNGKLLCVKKSTNESKGTLKFTYNGRLAAIALVTRNGASSLAYYIGINSGNTFSINKLGGGDIDVIVDRSKKNNKFSSSKLVNCTYD